MSHPDSAELDFRVLGPLRVVRDGVDVALHGDKPRAVLALLLMRRNRLVPTAAFAEEVWGRDAPEIQANLQVVISNLRRTLAEGRFDVEARRFVRTASSGYSILVADARYDLERFRRLRGQGNLARTARRPAEAARCYADALAEWGGERGLEDLGELAFAEAFAQTAEQELLGVLQARLDADLACRRHQEVLGELFALLRRYPLNDVFCSQLLVALARSGRSADAANEYHRFREQYAREMGSAVPEPLRRVWGSVSRQEEVAGEYGAPPTSGYAERTLVDDAHARLRGELVHRNGARTDVTGRLTMGRIGCDLLLADAKVSKTHAVISPTPDGFVINDLHSTNGTFVNDVLVVAPQVLAHLDRIKVGDTALVFRTLPG